ncbi:oocyte zinc finger protein XlCOF7.1-like [Bufo bufo]|uniref:oocyte zinc finger protein XlCOF7.1-like n=1 Tax=Bufo bufo TaxID=8384 RepID=UPI001ABE542A|nr:oocyte zinc finger protein XlCOF7.1-like [Bufo bufo]
MLFSVPISPSVHLDPHRREQANMETTIKCHEYFQQNPKQTKEGYSLSTKTTDVTHAILKFTLEIICLLTGEDYIVVKKTSSHGEGWSRTQSPILEPPPDSLIDVKNNEQKILDLTYKIIELLTREACEGLEEHQKSSRMESHQALTYLDNMVNGLSDHTSAHAMEESLSSDEKEEIHTPTDHRPQYLFGNIKVEATYDVRSIRGSNTYTSIDDTQHYPSSSIKEEPVSCDEANVTDPEIHATTGHEQQHASTHIKEEAVSCESRNLTDHTQQYPSLIKEELATYSGGNLTDFNVYTPTDHVVCASMEETSSCNGGSITNPIDVQQPPSNHVLAEPVLCDKGRPINATMNTEARSSSHTERENEDVQMNYSLFDKGNLDTDIYALIKHAQAKYTFTRIEDGSSSEGEENLKDVDSHTSADPDHTQRPPNGTGEAVPQTIQCPECSECFTRKSALINHRRTHRQEKLTCSKCGKVFSKRSSLQNHLTLHTGERPFACPICGKCFARKSNLISHETIHSGKASFICAECGRYFVCKVHLTKHQIIHEK